MQLNVYWERTQHFIVERKIPLHLSHRGTLVVRKWGHFTKTAQSEDCVFHRIMSRLNSSKSRKGTKEIQQLLKENLETDNKILESTRTANNELGTRNCYIRAHETFDEGTTIRKQGLLFFVHASSRFSSSLSIENFHFSWQIPDGVNLNCHQDINYNHKKMQCCQCPNNSKLARTMNLNIYSEKKRLKLEIFWHSTSNSNQ